MTETRHDGWLERTDDEGQFDEAFVSAPINCFHIERMNQGAWWMRVDLQDGRAVVVNLYARFPGRTLVAGHAEEEKEAVSK